MHLVRNLRLNQAHVLVLLRLPSHRLPFPQGTLRMCSLGLPDALLQQVHQSLAPAHLDEQLKALKYRIQRQTLAVKRHREQGGHAC